jgi:hypothetical protein
MKKRQKKYMYYQIIAFQGSALKSIYDQALHPIVTHFVIYVKKLLPRFTKSANDDEATLSDALKQILAPESTYTLKKSNKKYITEQGPCQDKDTITLFTFCHWNSPN